ncbi:hypothetical protein [Saccharopolyspora pogona]|uniref:hypothetical protein n=1 Tax=Saccharopolyspora pogona TaxID=333966 RepID=UPI00168A3B66
MVGTAGEGEEDVVEVGTDNPSTSIAPTSRRSSKPRSAEMLPSPGICRVSASSATSPKRRAAGRCP